MKLRAILCTTALGLGLGTAAGVAAQESSSVIGEKRPVDEKGIIGEKRGTDEEQTAYGTKTPATSSQLTKRGRAATSAASVSGTVSQPALGQRIDAAGTGRLREETVTAPNRGLAPRPTVGPGAMGQRSSNQNDGGKGPPNEPPGQNMGGLVGDAGWAGQSDEKLPHKEPKGPDKMPTALGSRDRLAGNAGLAGKSEDKPPKDPKGPDKLTNATLEGQTLETDAARARTNAAQSATQVRAADAAQQARSAVQSRP